MHRLSILQAIDVKKTGFPIAYPRVMQRQQATIALSLVLLWGCHTPEVVATEPSSQLGAERVLFRRNSFTDEPPNSSGWQ